MERPRQTQIFTDDFRQRIAKFTTNVYSDYEGLFMLGITGMGLLTLLLVFWIKVGQYGIVAYTEYWANTYPTTPLYESFMYQLLQIAGPVTEFITKVIWGFILIIVIIIYIKNLNQPPHSNKKTSGNDEPKVSLPSQRGVPLSDKTCPYCKSIKTKSGGKNHPGQTYCKSCRKYF